MKSNMVNLVDDFYDSCIYASIAHAIAMTKYPEFDYKQNWIGNCYCCNDGMGSRSIVIFDDHAFVGAVMDNTIDPSLFCYLSEFEGESKLFTKYREDLNDFFDTRTSDCLVSQFLFGEYNRIKFFGECSSILHAQFLSGEQRRQYWIDNYDFDIFAAQMVDDLFLAKQRANNGVVNLNDVQKNYIEKFESNGKRETYISLREIDII